MNSKSNVQRFREENHLTQSELASKARVSLRTIQRIEAGSIPKGFTLKSIAEALKKEPNDLLEQQETFDLERLKWINISTLLGLLIPFGGILAPLILIHKTTDQKVKTLGKKIIEIQITLVLLVSFSMILSPFIQKLFSLKFPLFIIPLLTLLGFKIVIALSNGVSLNKNSKLAIRLKNNFL